MTHPPVPLPEIPGPIALFDLDGTLADYDYALCRDLQNIAGPNDLPLGAMMGETFPYYLERRRQLITNQPGWFRSLPQRREGFDLLRAAQDIGFSVHILTKGPRTNRAAWTEKAEWCDRQVPELPIHVVTDKGMVYGRVLVDDWPPYGEAWLKWRKRGLLVLPAHPWNAQFRHPNAIHYDGTQLSLEAVRERLCHAFERKDGEP